MAKSKAARRRARMGSRSGSLIPYARQRPGGGRGLSNWTVGQQALTQAGAVVGGFSSPTSVPTWNPGASGSVYSLATGVPVTFQAYYINPALAQVAPSVGRAQIDELRGKLLFSTPSVPGCYDIAVAIYVSELTLTTSAWDVCDPMVPADAARDDYFFLESLTLNMCPYASNTANTGGPMNQMDLSIGEPIVIGGGQALNVTVSMIGPGALYCNPAFRVRVGPVS